jgi:hypothetical protein
MVTLIKEEEFEGEVLRTYQLNLVFNEQSIKQVNITDYYEEKHRTVINDSLILQLVSKLNGIFAKPLDYPGERKPYKEEIKLNGR